MEVIPTKLAGNSEQDQPKYPYVAWFVILAFVFWLVYITLSDGYVGFGGDGTTSTDDTAQGSGNASVPVPEEKESNQVKKYLTIQSVFYSVLTALIILAIAKFG
nr:hypothetical protein Cbor_5 [Cedratvirus borely]